MWALFYQLQKYYDPCCFVIKYQILTCWTDSSNCIYVFAFCNNFRPPASMMFRWTSSLLDRHRDCCGSCNLPGWAILGSLQLGRWIQEFLDKRNYFVHGISCINIIASYCWIKLIGAYAQPPNYPSSLRAPHYHSKYPSQGQHLTLINPLTNHCPSKHKQQKHKQQKIEVSRNLLNSDVKLLH